MIKSTWKNISIKPIINITGTDDFLIDYTKVKCVKEIIKKKPEIEKIEIDSLTVTDNKLIETFSNSLFSTEKLIIVLNANKLSATHISILKNRLDKNYFIIFIKKVPKKLNDIIEKMDLAQIDCQKMKFPSEKIEFIKNIFNAKSKQISHESVKAIIDANLDSLEDAYALSNQILNDYSNETHIDKNIIDIYTDGKAGTTVFKIVDAIVSKDKVQAIKLYDSLLLASNNSNQFVNLLLSTLEMKLSSIGKILASNQMGLDPAKELGYAPWQVKQIANILPKWSSGGLKNAISIVVGTDYKIKSGKTKAPSFELKKCLLRIAT
jgi:DNA polymerase-3 subunit delta